MFEDGKGCALDRLLRLLRRLKKTATVPFSADFLALLGSIKGAGVHSFIGGAALFAMSGKSDAENKCTAAFFNFLTSPDIQKFYHQSTGYVAITKAAYELAKKEGYYDKEPVAEVAIKQLSCRVASGTRLPHGLLPPDPFRDGA